MTKQAVFQFSEHSDKSKICFPSPRLKKNETMCFKRQIESYYSTESVFTPAFGLSSIMLFSLKMGQI